MMSEPEGTRVPGGVPKNGTESGGKKKVVKSVLKKRKARQNKKAAKQQRAALMNAMSVQEVKKEEPALDRAGGGAEVKTESGNADVKIEETVDEATRSQLDAVLQKFSRRAAAQYERSLQDVETEGSDMTEDYGGDESGARARRDPWSTADEEEELSNKQVKRASTLTVGLLKQMSAHPDVVELHDVNSSDPLLHVYLKSLHNAVPVPRHWCAKRRYLAGKVGVLKPPFRLPQYIEDTGIRQMREAEAEKDEMKSHAKGAARQRMRPHVGRLDIDFRVLQAAFFRFQTKPKMLQFGDLYYEGKELDAAAGAARRGTPGILSKELQRALGMIPATAQEEEQGEEGSEVPSVPAVPPPWLFNMQMYGPPPSYPHLRVPGVNAPLPPGAQYGFKVGGWGKPPVEEGTGRPLFGGDPLGVGAFGGGARIAAVSSEEIAAMGNHWGEFVQDFSQLEEEEEEGEGDEMVDEGEEEEESEMNDVEPEKKEEPKKEMSIPGTESGFGLATPAQIDLVKRTTATVEAEQQRQKQLFTVLEQQSSGATATTASASAGSLLGTTHTYKLPGTQGGSTVGSAVDLMKSERSKNVAVTFDPSDLEQLDGKSGKADAAAAAMLQKKYEEANKQQQADSQSALPPQSSRAEYEDLLEQHEAKKTTKKKKNKERFKF